MKPLIMLFFVLAALAAEAQVTINGVTLPATVKSGATELVLNGGGIRKKDKCPGMRM